MRGWMEANAAGKETITRELLEALIACETYVRASAVHCPRRGTLEEIETQCDCKPHALLRRLRAAIAKVDQKDARRGMGDMKDNPNS